MEIDFKGDATGLVEVLERDFPGCRVRTRQDENGRNYIRIKSIRASREDVLDAINEFLLGVLPPEGAPRKALEEIKETKMTEQQIMDPGALFAQGIGMLQQQMQAQVEGMLAPLRKEAEAAKREVEAAKKDVAEARGNIDKAEKDLRVRSEAALAAQKGDVEKQVNELFSKQESRLNQYGQALAAISRELTGNHEVKNLDFSKSRLVTVECEVKKLNEIKAKEAVKWGRILELLAEMVKILRSE